MRALMWLSPHPIPNTPADPYAVFDAMTVDGHSSWGHTAVFIGWLDGVFGEEAGQHI